MNARLFSTIKQEKMETKIILLCVVAALLFAFRYKPAKTNQTEKGMIKVSVLYRAGEAKTFDWNYYTSKHVPLVKSLLGDAVKTITVDKGIAGSAARSPAPYVAMFHMYFESLNAFQTSFAPHAEKIRKDIPNYTNIQAEVQISEVVQ